MNLIIVVRWRWNLHLWLWRIEVYDWRVDAAASPFTRQLWPQQEQWTQNSTGQKWEQMGNVWTKIRWPTCMCVIMMVDHSGEKWTIFNAATKPLLPQLDKKSLRGTALDSWSGRKPRHDTTNMKWPKSIFAQKTFLVSYRDEAKEWIDHWQATVAPCLLIIN